MGVMYTVVLVPVKVLGSVVNYRNGADYFADPLGKPSLLTYWGSLVEFSLDVLFLRFKRPADLAYAAVEDSGDGVAGVSRIFNSNVSEKGWLTTEATWSLPRPGSGRTRSPLPTGQQTNR
eukprot:g6354.t2